MIPFYWDIIQIYSLGHYHNINTTLSKKQINDLTLTGGFYKMITLQKGVYVRFHKTGITTP